MELSILHIFIDHGTYHGILRFCYKKEYHNLCIALATYKINTQVKEVIEIFKNNLLSDPTNPNLVNIIPTKLILKEIYQLTDCEKILEGLVSTGDSGQVNFGDLTCKITKDQVKRVYNFFSSFITNFSMLDAVYNIYINMLKVAPEVVLPEPVVVEIPPPLEIIISSPPDLAATTLLEEILNSYTINNILKSFVIHHIFNHLQYISNNISYTTDTITINNLYNNFNNDYTISIYNTILDTELDNIVSFNQKKIVENILIIFNLSARDHVDNLNMYLLLFILYIYQYRHIVSKYPDYDIDNLFKKELQVLGLNNVLKPISVIIDDVLEDKDEILIDEISNKYKHLIPVSESSFLALAAKEYKENNLKQIKDFNISNKKLLNISKLIHIEDKIKYLKSDLVNTNDYTDRSGLLNFKPKIITITYDHFKNYLSNQQTVTTVKNIPKSVINLFDFFNRNMSKIFTDTTLISTLEYYKILYNNLPTPKAYSHYTYLFIIYNLIIPYYYDHHKIEIFEDVFL